MALYCYAIESRKTDGALALHRFETWVALREFVDDGYHPARSTAWDSDGYESDAREVREDEAREIFPQAFSDGGDGGWYPGWSGIADSPKHPSYGWTWLDGWDGVYDTSDAPYDDLETEVVNPTNRCPVCGSYDIEGGFIEANVRSTWQKVRCACGAEWVDIYEYSHSIILRHP